MEDESSTCSVKEAIFAMLSALHTQKIAIFKLGPAYESLRIVLTITAFQSEIQGKQKETAILARKNKL